MLALGIDPDLHNTALALVEDLYPVPRIVRVGVVRVDKKFKGADAVIAMSAALRGEFLTGRFCAAASDASVVVEGQQIYRGSAESNPEDMLKIAAVAGAALACACACHEERHAPTHFPLPHEWKGSVPKHIHQGRTARKLGWGYELKGGKKPYCVPRFADGRVGLAFAHLKDSDWKHVMDAIGLALWGIDEARAAARKAENLSRSIAIGRVTDEPPFAEIEVGDR